jgi:hypothetical protein
MTRLTLYVGTREGPGTSAVPLFLFWYVDMWASGLVSNIMSLVDMEEILASGVRIHYVLIISYM